VSGARARPERARQRSPSGFTLVEVLVALVVVAIGMAAVIGAMGSAADTASYMRDKTFAQWIAFNHVAEVRLAGQVPSVGKSDGELDFAGHHWRWEQEVTPFESFPGIVQLDVRVQQADTPAGKDAPWMASTLGVMGAAVAQPRLLSDYAEYTPAPPGTQGVPGTPGVTPTTTTPTTTPLGTPSTGTSLGSPTTPSSGSSQPTPNSTP
jgi:general secretion pathway protein I